MDASFHFMRWSLVQECLATADFSSLAFSQLVLCSLRRNERFRPVSPILLALMKIRAYGSKALQ